MTSGPQRKGHRRGQQALSFFVPMIPHQGKPLCIMVAFAVVPRKS